MGEKFPVTQSKSKKLSLQLRNRKLQKKTTSMEEMLLPRLSFLSILYIIEKIRFLV